LLEKHLVAAARMGIDRFGHLVFMGFKYIDMTLIIHLHDSNAEPIRLDAF
jgi:hypothetical protein